MNKYLKQIAPFVDAIAETLGKNCEVVLHDFHYPERSIVKIANGHVTGRTVGGPTTDLALRFLGIIPSPFTSWMVPGGRGAL